MSKINTVLGPISPEQLGTTLVHEHCLIGFSGWECDPLPGGLSRAEMIEACVQALVPARDLGLRSIIDATPPDLGRDVDRRAGRGLEVIQLCGHLGPSRDHPIPGGIRLCSHSRVSLLVSMVAVG